MAEKHYAIIDVETTGGTPYNSRITDISIFLTDGTRVIDEFSSLVNPEMQIPSFITELTGIDNDMVAGAPTFDEIARNILDITENATFVAHNVNFDYGMIKGEFQRYQYNFEREKLCTVRLARSWIPGHSSYGLGRICQDLGIPINGRHRARGDAEATVELFHRIYQISDGALTISDQKWISQLPEGLDKSEVIKIPESPGIFYLYDENGETIYLAHADNMFKKVVSHIKSKAKKSQEIISLTRDIDFEEIGSSLLSSLKVSKEVERLKPRFTKMSSKKAQYVLDQSTDLFGYSQLSLVKTNVPTMSQSFKNKKEGERYLWRLRDQYMLCARMCGLNQEACSSGPIQQCPGACQGHELPASYNDRVSRSLALSDLGDMIVIDPIDENEQAFVIIENNQYLGYGIYSVYEDGLNRMEDLKQYLVPDDSTFEKVALIRDFIKKRRGKTVKVQFHDVQ